MTILAIVSSPLVYVFSVNSAAKK